MAKTASKRATGKSEGGSPGRSIQKASGGSGQERARARSEGPKSEGFDKFSDALVKLLESPLVAELLALGASAALASFTAQRFRSGDDGRSTRRALKAAVKSAGTAMGARLATEVDEIKKSAKKAREEA